MFFCNKKMGIKCADVFLSIGPNFKRNKYFITEYHDIRENFDDGEKVLSEDKEFITIVNDIDKSDEDISLDFNKNVRYEIRRAIKEGVECAFICNSTNASISDRLLDEMNEQYILMYKSKGIKANSIKEKLLKYRDYGILGVSFAKINGNPVVWHIYYFGQGISRLMYSFSVFRDSDSSEERNAIGRANRYLHYYDMLQLRDKYGVTEYDWGGCGSSEEVKFISDFKRGFGGTEKIVVQRTTTRHGLVNTLFQLYIWVNRLFQEKEIEKV